MQTLIPILTLLATASGSGYAASRLFDWLRVQMPRPTAAEWKAAPWLARQGWALLYAPGLVQVAVFVLAGTLAALASALLAALTGRDALAVLDATLAALASQIVYRWGLPMIPEMESETATTTRPEGA